MINICCKNCQSSDYEMVLDVSKVKDTYLDYLKFPYADIKRQYVMCKSCKLIYRTVVLDSKEKEILYEKFRDYGLRKETKEDYFERIANLPKNRSENSVKCEYLKRYIKLKGNILDIGCGAGVFLHTFRKCFPQWKTHGVEPTEGFSDVAKTYGIKVINTYLTDRTFQTSFDLITLNHVIEHIDNYESMFSLVSKYLKKEGIMYVEVPSADDIGFLEIGHDRFMCQHDVIFSKKFLAQFLVKFGFNVIHIENYLSVRKRNNIRVIAQLR